MKKSTFTLPPVRELTGLEVRFAENANDVIAGRTDIAQIGEAPACLSPDCMARPIVLSKRIASKIAHDHGSLVPENLILNANDWDVALKNVQDTVGAAPNPDKINLVKLVPGTDNYLIFAAARDNGFFTVTHYEVVPKGGNELKSLLGRGDLIGRNGNPLAPSDFLSAPPAQGGSVGVLGRNDTPNVSSVAAKVNPM